MGSYADTQGNSTSTIAIRDNNVSVTVDESSKVASEGNYCYALSLDSTYPGETGPFTGVNVTMKGEVTGLLLAVDSFEGNTIQFKEEYKETLTNEGYIVSESTDGMVTVTDVAEGVLNETVLHAAIVDGANVSLGADIVLTKAITIPVGITATINLNGFDITAPDTDAFIVEGTLTINDENNEGVVWASNNNASTACAVWAKQSGKVIINGGIYKVGHDGASKDANKANWRNDCIYARDNASIEINGGVFMYTGEVDETNVQSDGHRFLLNCRDADYKAGTCSITVKGGTFHKFDPGATSSENPVASYVATGYKSNQLTDPDLYEVVENGNTEFVPL